MTGLLLLGLIFRSFRWLLISGYKLEDLQPFFISSVFGVFGNFVLPFRLGEVIRVIALKKNLEVPLSFCIGTSIVDRSIDFLALFLGALMLIFILPRIEIIHTIFFFSFLFMLILCFMFVLFTKLRHKVAQLSKSMMEKLSKRFSRHNDSIEFITDVQESIFNSVVFNIRFRTLMVTTIVFCIDCLTLLVLIQAFSEHVPFYAGLLLWVFMSASSILPSGPGFIGVYQVAAIFGLSLVDIEPVVSIAIATIYQGIILILFSLLVCIIMAFNGAKETKKLWTDVRSAE
jgi:uncharacterized protein (TIRG00374 family)